MTQNTTQLGAPAVPEMGVLDYGRCAYNAIADTCSTLYDSTARAASKIHDAAHSVRGVGVWGSVLLGEAATQATDQTLATARAVAAAREDALTSGGIGAAAVGNAIGSSGFALGNAAASSSRYINSALHTGVNAVYETGKNVASSAANVGQVWMQNQQSVPPINYNNFADNEAARTHDTISDTAIGNSNAARAFQTAELLPASVPGVLWGEWALHPREHNFEVNPPEAASLILSALPTKVGEAAMSASAASLSENGLNNIQGESDLRIARFFTNNVPVSMAGTMMSSHLPDVFDHLFPGVRQSLVYNFRELEAALTATSFGRTDREGVAVMDYRDVVRTVANIQKKLEDGEGAWLALLDATSTLKQETKTYLDDERRRIASELERERRIMRGEIPGFM